MGDGVRITRSLEIGDGELEFRFARSGGPGGQNVNRRETKVELVFDVARSPSLGPRQRAKLMDRLSSRLDSQGRLHVVVSDERSQARNRELAVERFRELVAGALRPRKRRKRTRPSRAAKERRLKEKKQRSRRKRERSWTPDRER